MKSVNVLVRLFLLVAMSLIPTNCAVNPVTGKSQVMMMSEAQEIQMGKEYDPQIVAAFGEYKMDELLSFLQAKTIELGKISHRPKLEYHVRILDSPVVNAFAVPGGYLYFTRGILAQFNNEAELIGVLGHEMGHVAARHSVSQQSRQQLGQLLLIGGMIASEKVAEYGQQAMQAMQVLFLKFSRDAEKESDRLGVEYMTKAGYDGYQMAEFFEVLNKMGTGEGQGELPTFLSTHPSPTARNATVKKLTEEWQDSVKRSDWMVNSESYLKMIDGMVYGEDPRQGYTEGNVFYHPDLKFRFTYPNGWQLQNSPMQVATAPKSGKAMIIFSMAQQKTPEEAIQATTQQYKLTATDSKKVTVNGLPAIAVMSKQVQQDQATGRQAANQVLSFYISYGGQVYVFHGVSAEADFKAHQSEIEATLSSFAPLNDRARLNVKPKKVFIRPAGRSGTLSQVLTAQGVPQDKLKEVALLNNLELNSDVQSGKLIKILGE